MAATVEITTTQNVTIEYDLARLRDRTLAYLLDGMIVGLGYGLFILLIAMVASFMFVGQGWLIFFYILFFAVWFGYHTLCETLMNGQSIGKKAVGIKVVRLDGKEPQWSDVVLRALLQIIDLISCAGIIGILLIKTTPKGQRLGDMAANTTVIKIQSLLGRFTLRDILNIASIDSYKPEFPQVKQLAEQDMILMKTVLTRYQNYPNEAHAEAVDHLTERLREVLNISLHPRNNVEFLRTLLRDYIVLTR